MASVLLVDDEPEVTEVLQGFFKDMGLTCWTAKNSDEALKVITDQTPNLVLLDKRLDGSRLDGFGILDEVGKLPIRSKMKIYIVTGYPDEETEARAKELGADGYLVKPLPIEKLIGIAKGIGSQSS